MGKLLPAYVEEDKMCVFRVNVARLCGLNAAIIAEYLYQLYNNEACGDPEMYRHGDFWVRKSALMMTGEFPFLSIDMVKDAVKVLKEKNIIRKGCFNENKFDHTSWYTFTDFGMKVMEANVV